MISNKLCCLESLNNSQRCSLALCHCGAELFTLGVLVRMTADADGHTFYTSPCLSSCEREGKCSFAWRRHDGRLLEKTKRGKKQNVDLSEWVSAADWDWQAPAVELRQTNTCMARNMRLWQSWKALPPPTSRWNQSDTFRGNVIQAGDDENFNARRGHAGRGGVWREPSLG